VAEYITAGPDHVPGTGFDVLLYWPFDFAYVLLAAVLFETVNVYFIRRTGRSVWFGSGVAAIVFIVWFFAAFLAVGSLHLGLGGKGSYDAVASNNRFQAARKSGARSFGQCSAFGGPLLRSPEPKR
jgi:hypothetical protein